MPKKGEKPGKKLKEIKYGVRKSYSVGDWVLIQRKEKSCGPGRIEQVLKIAGAKHYTVKTIDGTVHVALTTDVLRPRPEG